MFLDLSFLLALVPTYFHSATSSATSGIVDSAAMPLVGPPSYISRQVSLFMVTKPNNSEVISRQVSTLLTLAPVGVTAISRQVGIYNSLLPQLTQTVSRQVGIYSNMTPANSTIISRQVSVEYSQVTPIPPTGFAVKLGRLDAGNLASLGSSDGDSLRVCKFFVPNSATPPVNVETTATSPTANPSTLSFRTVSKVTAAGQFAIKLELWNWTANAGAGGWDPVDFRETSCSTALNTVDLVGTGNLTRYVHSGDNQIKARYQVRVSGIVTNANWCHEADQVVWLITN